MSPFDLQKGFDEQLEEEVEQILAEAFFSFLKSQESEEKKDGN